MAETVSGSKALGIFGLVLISVFLVIAARNFFSEDKIKITGNVVQDVKAANDGVSNAQVVELSLKDYNYYPNVLNFKRGEPAKIIVDTDKVKGCFSSIVIPDLGIKKFARAGDNVIEFTPTKSGEFSFSCPMGMGFGKIIVN